MASTLLDRLARFVTRCGKRAEVFAISSASGEPAGEVPAGDGVVEEINSICEDVAAAAARQTTCIIRALDASRQVVASLTVAVRPPPEPAPQPLETTRVIQLLASHAQELTRLVVASQQAILGAYQSALRDAARRAAEAEARAAAAEEIAASADQQALPALQGILGLLQKGQGCGGQS